MSLFNMNKPKRLLHHASHSTFILFDFVREWWLEIILVSTSMSWRHSSRIDFNYSTASVNWISFAILFRSQITSNAKWLTFAVQFHCAMCIWHTKNKCTQHTAHTRSHSLMSARSATIERMACSVCRLSPIFKRRSRHSFAILRILHREISRLSSCTNNRLQQHTHSHCRPRRHERVPNGARACVCASLWIFDNLQNATELIEFETVTNSSWHKTVLPLHDETTAFDTENTFT